MKLSRLFILFFLCWQGLSFAGNDNGQVTRFVYDGNVTLHEWTFAEEERPQSYVNAKGDIVLDEPEPVNADEVITWLFDANSFVPAAKIVGGEKYSIACDYLGTPVQAYDANGKKVWDCELDIYGAVKEIKGAKSFVPFRYQGQYEDDETGLYYNRFRYYSPDTGTYISQDPIGYLGNNANFYAYVPDTNSWLDVFGLDCSSDAAKLRKNMQKQRIAEPSHKNSAHHIVMSNSKDPKMVELRHKMKQLGIDKNAAENGAYLPTSSKIKAGANTNAQ